MIIIVQRIESGAVVTLSLSMFVLSLSLNFRSKMISRLSLFTYSSYSSPSSNALQIS
jgi:hypothetical protein